MSDTLQTYRFLVDGRNLSRGEARTWRSVRRVVSACGPEISTTMMNLPDGRTRVVVTVPAGSPWWDRALDRQLLAAWNRIPDLAVRADARGRKGATNGK